MGQEKGVPMITNKNQACFTKKSGCGLQEEINTILNIVCQVRSQLLPRQQKENGY